MTSFKAEIKRLMRNRPDVVAYARYSINNGIGPTESYKKKGALKVRKQNYLALYKWLKTQPRVFCYRDLTEYKGINLYFIEKKPMPEFFEAVQDFFADEFEMNYGGMVYEKSGLSECTIDDIEVVSDVSGRDFVFDIGNLNTGKIQYWGHWHRRKWAVLNIYSTFQLPVLNAILKGRRAE
jgi:hypothetical protein